MFNRIKISLTRLRLTAYVLLVACLPSKAQSGDVFIHSHNDYYQRVPFYEAYAQQVYSIEVDVYVTESGEVLVAHDPHELDAGRKLDDLYIQPIVKVYEANGGRAWRDSDKRFVLMIDLKTSSATTLPRVADLLARHPHVFDESKNPFAVQVVITGNMPEPHQFSAYPRFMGYDGRLDVAYASGHLEQVAFISENFARYSTWKGKGRLPEAEYNRLKDAIATAHAMGKKIRFWGTPDDVVSWSILRQMGVDIINTDRIADCRTFFDAN